MEYYKTGDYREKIKKVEVEKETEHCVYVKNEYNGKFERCNKISNCYVFFKTFIEAKEYLENKKNNKIVYLEKQLSDHRKELSEIINLQE